MAEGKSGARNVHIGPLDGLRAIAISLVFLYHLTPGRYPHLGLRALPFKLADFGWTGVDLFFVLSGFLITGKLLAARGDEHRFRDFYTRRSLRIFPLYYAALAFVLIILPLANAKVHMAPIESQLPYWLYYSNFVKPPLETDALVRIGHFWSLAIEEQFYLVWPTVIFLTSSRRARMICIAIVLAAPLIRYALASTGGSELATYGWTPSHADGLAVGAFLALVYADEQLRKHALRWSIVAAALSAPLLLWATWRGKITVVNKSLATPEAILLRTLLISAASLLYGAFLVMALEVRALGKVLSGTIMRLLARYSYGMYVFHFMLYPWVDKTFAFPRNNGGALLFFVVASAISIALAVVSYHAFEAPFIALKSRFAEGRVRDTGP